MMKVGEPRPELNSTIEALVRELQSLDSNAFPALHALAESELFRLRGGIADSLDVVGNRPVKVRAKVEIPQSVFPGINFVGKLLGPKGKTLRSIQETTNTKMAILGAGSLRDDSKEKELLSNGDPKFQHLKQKLHLQVDSLGSPSEAYYRLAHALAEVRKIMIPDQDEAQPTVWVQPNSLPPILPGALPPLRNIRPPLRGPAPPPELTVPRPTINVRGRGRPWVGRGAATNGIGAIPQPVPALPEAFPNNGNPIGYPPMAIYEQPTFSAGVFEDFGNNYGQDDPWGKAGISELRGRGQVHPYIRPGIKLDQP